MEKEDSECYRRQGFETPHRKEQQFEEAVASHRWEAETPLQAETARVAAQTVSPNERSFLQTWKQGRS